MVLTLSLLPKTLLICRADHFPVDEVLEILQKNPGKRRRLVILDNDWFENDGIPLNLLVRKLPFFDVVRSRYPELLENL